ncbi:hypothetical protein QCA50_013858 [Cerrena zonata]|uniref:Uncharacterized protein n=1 Tax=Cerrena zonata TaxID=2478898 RepID=A0AAW0G2A4_9APHY
MDVAQYNFIGMMLTAATYEFALQIWWYETVVIKGQAHHDGKHTLHHHHRISLARTAMYVSSHD